MRLKVNIILAMVFVFNFTSAQVTSTYNFNALNLGNLNNQDNWKTIQGAPNNSDFEVALSAGNVVAPDGSQAVYFSAGGPGVGRTATRKSTANFSFNFQEADIAEVEWQMHTAWWGCFFGVGFDADGDGHIAPGAANEEYDGGIIFSVSDQNPISGCNLTLPNGNSVTFTIPQDGWNSFRMNLDFTANGNAGMVALFFKDNCTGDWTPINEVQGLSIELTPGSGNKNDHGVWDGIFFHSEGGTGAFDNIIITTSDNGGMQSQYITFQSIPNKLTINPPFQLSATSTSGLPVEFEVISGPANISGNTVTLTGDAGIVVIKAKQPGNGNWAPAPEVTQEFEVVNADNYYAEVLVRRPTGLSKVYMNELSMVTFVASTSIEHPEVLSVENVYFTINGQQLPVKEKNGGYFNAYWTPPDFGNYTMVVKAVITEGNITEESVTFEVSDEYEDLNIPVFDDAPLTGSSTVFSSTVIFPTFVGSFSSINANLEIHCPTGGCDIWDRIGYMEAKGPDGNWIELIRYITPYNKNCTHHRDLMDYSSILQGAVDVRFTIDCQGNGFLIDVNMDLIKGTPVHKYSSVNEIWRGNFPFGNYLNLQPVPVVTWNFPSGTTSAKLKIINSGHGWGENNTGNAAEFYAATHNIRINNAIAFTQPIIVDCNPNPDGCQPQNGTWYYDRAGWCPGSISKLYDYSLDQYLNLTNIMLQYEFDPNYVDLCNPDHPDCITGVTCTQCEDSYNPVYLVSGQIISYSDDLYADIPGYHIYTLSLEPNPARETVILSSPGNIEIGKSEVFIYNANGLVMKSFTWDGTTIELPLSNFPSGLYIVRAITPSGTETRKLVIE